MSADGECEWHAWGVSSASLALVHVVGLYMHPEQAARPAPEWTPRCASLLERCATFHVREFPGSALTWSLHGPLALPLRACHSTWPS